jgi:hypothetical protein
MDLYLCGLVNQQLRAQPKSSMISVPVVFGKNRYNRLEGYVKALEKSTSLL